ncbi:hypothetical protein [Clostridium baratii]|uniref:Gp2 n=1 Tax=Clostridium baratii TaxID=1561 RepID=A0A174QNV3_9CLOT|nr:gp2 [Clostridium baratii]
MKIGMRTPSIKKSVSARTTGKFNRAVKSSINPLYGKKGMGWINDPKRAAYNKVYNKTTVSAKELIDNNIEDKQASFLEVIGGFFSFLGNLIMLLVSLAQVIFYGAIVAVMIYFIFIIIF